MDNLGKLREKIDLIDDSILDLLSKRMEVVNDVGELKKSQKSIVYRPEREKSIVDRLTKRAKGMLNRASIEAIFVEIFAVSRNYEMPEQVAYLGPSGSFTHQAAESRFGANSEYLDLASIQSVFEAVETGRVRFGVVPIENNQQGPVQETLEYLGKYDLKIVSEIPMAIHFSLATLCESVHDIKKIYSKDIAFMQCKKFLEELFRDRVELIPVNSTSYAVEQSLKEEGSAAICSHIAAREFNVPILFNNIEDSENNQTRFLILGKNIENQVSKNDKTTIIVRLPHSDEPGSLAMLLQAFHEASINMTKIESHPAREGKKFKYWFFIEFDGHYKDTKVQEALKSYKRNITWLGSYVRLC